MNNEIICEKSAKCPIYAGVLGSDPLLVDTYKILYCDNGQQGRDKCKRYQVANRMGKCPPDLLPNSRSSVDEIIRLMEN